MFFDGLRPSNVANVDPRVRFWTLNYLWPEQTLTHISLAEAVQIVGRRLFGDAWSGKEPAVELQLSLSDALSPMVPSAEIQRGCWILYNNNQEYRSRCGSVLAMPTDAEWAIAVEIARKVADETGQAYSRYHQVCHVLIQAFKYDTIRTAIRPNEGGAEVPLAREDWNSEACFCRFDCCQLDPQSIFSPRAIIAGGWWIYVERASFEAAMQGQRQVDVGGAAAALISDDRISPYIKTAITMALALDLTPDNQVDKAALELMVLDYWTGPGELSKRDCDRLATLLRQPESKLGKASPSRRRAAKSGQG